jgi:hypothetical protein
MMAVPSATLTLRALLGDADGYRITLGQRFVGSDNAAGPLARFVRDRRGRALDMYLLLVAGWETENEPVALPALVWARALGVADLATPEVLISRNWSWLERERLVSTERAGRTLAVTPLCEDGSGRPYERPVSSFALSHAYFIANYNNRVSLAGKAVLFLALAHGESLSFISGPPPIWHGLSRDTIKRGLRVLVTLGILAAEGVRVDDPLTTAGYRLERRYMVLPPFRTSTHAVPQ